MDIASNFAVAVAPPPFQKEVEEARRDSQQRTAIQEVKESAQSKSQSHIGDRRGSTEGENSLLTAQQRGISDAHDDLKIKERLPKRKKKGKRESKPGQDDRDNEHNETERHLEEMVAKRLQDLDRTLGQSEDQNDEVDYELLEELQSKQGFDPDTGFYYIPAWKHHPARSVFLEFRENNVHFLEQFSDRETAIGLINFALTVFYGRIIPAARKGQVVENHI